MKDYRKKSDTPEKRQEARERSSRHYRDNPKYKEKEKERRGGLNQRYSFSKRLARKRGKEWSLTKDQYAALISQPCYYCENKLGEPVSVGVGLDRLDNTNGYMIDNVVCCCDFCNKIKGDKLSSQEMKVVATTLIKMRGLENYQPSYNTEFHIQQRTRIFGRVLSEDTKTKISQAAKSRKSWAGDSNPRSKLNMDIVKDIRKDFANGESVASLSERYKTTQSVIRNVVNNITWVQNE